MEITNIAELINLLTGTIIKVVYPEPRWPGHDPCEYWIKRSRAGYPDVRNIRGKTQTSISAASELGVMEAIGQPVTEQDFARGVRVFVATREEAANRRFTYRPPQGSGNSPERYTVWDPTAVTPDGGIGNLVTIPAPTDTTP